MDQKPATNPSDPVESISAQTVAKAQIAVATCLGIHRGSIASDEAPEETSPWHPFISREEWQEFDAASDRWLKKRAAQERSAA